MRLIHLYIKDHLLLHDLDLQFDRSGRSDDHESYRLDFLVGVNGSGKSTLLRTLVEIFSSLQTGQGAEYEFMLEYELENNHQPTRIAITKKWNPDEKLWKFTSTIRIGNLEITDSDNSVLDTKYLPRKIIVYTTGSESEWDQLLDQTYQSSYTRTSDQSIRNDPIQRTIKEIPGHEIGLIEALERIPEGESPFFLIRGSQMNSLTLCGLLRSLAEPSSSDRKTLPGLLDTIGMGALIGFSFRFRLYDSLSDKSFYNALMELEPKPYVIHQASDRLVVFDLIRDIGAIKRILDKFNGAFELFHELDIQLKDDPTDTRNPTLQEVNLFFQKKEVDQTNEDDNNSNIPGVFLLDWLSDGERAFLGRMALLAMLDTEDSLIILDEPEVHFNDYWKREIVRLLDGMMRGHSNHALITTHSSILLSDVTEGQITVFVKSPSGFTEQRRPGIKTFGADPSEIMMVTFDAELSSGAKSEDELISAIKFGNREKVVGLLEMIGPGMWRFRLKQRLEEIDAASTKSS